MAQRYAGSGFHGSGFRNGGFRHGGLVSFGGFGNPFFYYPSAYYGYGNDYVSNVVGDILASESRGESRVDRANDYARQQAYDNAVANLAALRAYQAATERAEIDRLTLMENSRAQPPKPPSAEFLATQKRFESKP